MGLTGAQFLASDLLNGEEGLSTAGQDFKPRAHFFILPRLCPQTGQGCGPLEGTAAEDKVQLAHALSALPSQFVLWI